ncbi:MAG: hypothetical protein FWG40_11365 [Peptococcaceae bacterium]|nr:hypothetical protein [Peptococcaceae bacterium]
MVNSFDYYMLMNQKASAELQLTSINGDIIRLQSEIDDLEQAQAEWVLCDGVYTAFLSANSSTNLISDVHCESQWLTGYKIQLNTEVDCDARVQSTYKCDEQIEYFQNQIAMKTGELSTQRTNVINTQARITTLKKQIITTQNQNILTQNKQGGPI